MRHEMEREGRRRRRGGVRRDGGGEEDAHDRRGGDALAAERARRAGRGAGRSSGGGGAEGPPRGGARRETARRASREREGETREGARDGMSTVAGVRDDGLYRTLGVRRARRPLPKSILLRVEKTYTPFLVPRSPPAARIGGPAIGHVSMAAAPRKPGRFLDGVRRVVLEVELPTSVPDIFVHPFSLTWYTEMVPPEKASLNVAW